MNLDKEIEGILEVLTPKGGRHSTLVDAQIKLESLIRKAAMSCVPKKGYNKDGFKIDWTVLSPKSIKFEEGRNQAREEMIKNVEELEK